MILPKISLLQNINKKGQRGKKKFVRVFSCLFGWFCLFAICFVVGFDFFFPEKISTQRLNIETTSKGLQNQIKPIETRLHPSFSAHDHVTFNKFEISLVHNNDCAVKGFSDNFGF